MGFSKRFRDASKEEKEHAENLIDYQNMRGGRVVFREIENRLAMNGAQHWKPLRQALSLRRLSTSPSSTCTMADSHGDAQMTDYLEGTYLKEQVEAIKEIADLVTKM